MTERQRQNLTVLERAVVTLATLFFAGVASMTFNEIQKMSQNILELRSEYAVQSSRIGQLQREVTRMEEIRERDRQRLNRLEQWRYSLTRNRTHPYSDSEAESQER